MLAAIVAGHLVFAAATVFLLESGSTTPSAGQSRALERAGKLEDLRAREEKELHENAWIDEKSGIARISIDRAMELELKTLREKPVGPAAPIQPRDLNPTLIHPPEAEPAK